jgi:imidazolonepropionase-like amidohydrolase
MLATSAWLLALVAPGARAADDVVALVGGRIEPVSAPAIERGTLVIAGGKIAAVGASLVPPAGARIVDVSGQVVYPGLIDALTRIGLVEISAVVASNDSREMGEINPQAQAWIALNAHSETIPVARANGLTAVLSAPEGGLISGQSAFIHLTGTTPDALTLKTPAALHMVYPSGEPAPERGQAEPPEPKTFEERVKDKQKNQEKELRRLANLVEEARAYGGALDAAKAGTLPAPKPDLVMAALVPAARGTLPVVMHAEREADIRGAVAFAEQQHLKLIVAGGLEAWRCADLLHSKDVPVLLPVLVLPARESDDYDAAYANAARLHAAGVRFAIVTDDEASNARNLPYHAAMARAFGLPADVALRAITLSPAEIFGLGARLGSLTIGKEADVTVSSGDIMDARSQVTHVFIAGREQSLETRHTRLYKAFKDRP